MLLNERIEVLCYRLEFRKKKKEEGKVANLTLTSIISHPNVQRFLSAGYYFLGVIMDLGFYDNVAELIILYDMLS